jgi:hypothetical protein
MRCLNPWNIDGEKDHTVRWAIVHAAHKRQKRNPAVTEIVEMPNRRHSLTIDHGWREVAQTALDFVKPFARSVAPDDGEVARFRSDRVASGTP